MKKTNEQFEQNISRLVKSTNESATPPENFTQNLTEQGLRELKKRKSGSHWHRNLVAIAALLIVGAVLFSIITPATRKAKMKVYSDNASTEFQTLIANSKVSDEVAGKVNGKISIVDTKQIANAPPSPNPAIPRSTKKSVSKPKMESLGTQLVVDGVTSSPSSIPQTVSYYTRDDLKAVPGRRVVSLNAYGTTNTEGAYKCVPKPSQQMAHGGTTPPNGEDVDAMFFKNYGVNPFVDTEDDHLSTFAIDVDTGSYTVCKGFLQDGHLPPNDAVRVEEFVNYFSYDYAAPQEETFAVYAEAMPWTFGTGRKNSYLMQIGIQGMEIPEENRKPAVLTFVIDVSGSMKRESRLGLVKKSLEMLVDRLRPEDQIGIAVYGSRGRTVLKHTGLNEKATILEAIRLLQTGGSTNAEEGITIGYQMAEEAFKKGCINRVILCSDGVANVGRTGPNEILEVIKKKTDMGITLSALEFGMGNYNDVLMERLGDKGNGYYAYIHTIDEAKRLFGENLTGTLQVIARDVKIQVDFNPDVVRSYRLIGYENRDVADKDFRNDTVDGGEIGAGHSTTALYELKLWPQKQGLIATTYIRYKDPDTFEVTEISRTYDTSGIAEDFTSISRSFALSSVVTEFAEILRESYWAKGASLENTLPKAQRLNSEYPNDHEVIELIHLISRSAKLNDEKKSSQDTQDIEDPPQEL